MSHALLERVRYGADPQQFFELWCPKGASLGVAVMIHGGFWRAKYDLSHANPFCAALVARGFAMANLEYRRIGNSGGGWPGSFDDVLAGVTVATERLGGVPVVIGHSAGGHLALLLATTEIPLRAVVALAPVADLRLAYELNLSNGAVAEFLGGSPDSNSALYDQACPSKHAASVRRVLVHGTNDEDVPIGISRAYIEARKNDLEPPTLIEIPNAKHMELIDPESAAGAEVIEIVLRLM
jgi:dipeptidyl aminopeptidase/acylaminoacyl peptidase